MQFIEQVNNHHPMIKFAAETSITEITLMDTKSISLLRCSNVQIFSLSHPPGVKKGCFKGEALRTNSCKEILKRKLKMSNHILLENGLGMDNL